MILYLAEEKQAAISTLNQAINALKSYYGTMLKKKFLREIERPRKDKKLPIVLNQEEVANQKSSGLLASFTVLLCMVWVYIMVVLTSLCPSNS